MKNHHLKIFSLIATLILTVGTVFAYQTLAFDFPPNSGSWIVVYNKSQGNETIIQYVPSGQTYESWNRALIVHSYRNSAQMSATSLLRSLTARLEYMNSYSQYTFERATSEDAIATRCVVSNAKMRAQCDIYRAMTSFDGYITMQYVNRNSQAFKADYLNWLSAIKKAKPYYANFRSDRYLDKDFTFEL